MEKVKSRNHFGSFLPPSGRHSVFLPSGNSYNVKSELLASPKLPPLRPGGGSESGHFGHRMYIDSSGFNHDISRMPDNPPKNLGHRRAHSEILTLPDDTSFNSDLGAVDGFDGPSLSDETEEDLLSMYNEIDAFNSNSATSTIQVGEPSSAAASGSMSYSASAAGTHVAENTFTASSERPRVRHQHSQSMDESTAISSEMLMSGTEEASAADKKAISAAKLAELALIDPKRAKRIWANRQSAARSKERKMRYIAELERKVQTLQNEATSLSAQLTLLQKDTNGLSAENNELKLRLQTMEQQVHLQDALNDALKEEIQHLKVLTGLVIPNGGPMMNFPPSFGGNQQFFPTDHAALHTLLAAHQFQQLQIRPQQQHHQFQQQLHQYQQQLHQYQQQRQHQQRQEQHLQQIGDLRMRGLMPSTTQNENATDVNPSSSKD